MNPLLANGKLRLRNGVLALVASIPAAPADPGPAVEGTIAVANERQTRWIYQRIGVSKAVPVAGTSTAPAGTTIEARIVDETTGIALSGWSVVGTVAADGSYAGTLVAPQGKWYRRQVRIANSSTAIATETASFGVGIGIAELGQSNMDAYFHTSSYFRAPLGDPAAYEYYGTPNRLRRVGNTNDAFPPNTLNGTGGYGSFASTGTRNDGYVFVANLVAQNTGLPVFIINMAVNGSKVASWLSGQTNWTNFANGLNSIGNDCELMLWYQGEADDTMPPATYQARLSTLMGQCHALTGRDASSFKFGVISIGPSSINNTWATTQTGFGLLRDAQCTWANSTPGAFFVTAAHDADMTAGTDTIHIMMEQKSHLGRRYAKSILAQLGIGTTAAGPRMTAATRIGATVYVQVAHTGGTALQDGTGSAAGASLGGFQYFDSLGAEIVITGSAITGPSTFELYLASTPTGQGSLSYASQNAPHNLDRNDVKSTFLPASILRDNAAYYKTAIDTPLGSPLQPCINLPVTGA